ncbi:hypothetical protein A5722_14880 [Mycobacterium vulneris]|nr:hypothetical protein A5722_14880 [Mycolicibacterium vulneris]OCB66213.1 hypothetical protein A5729_12385 [Mycolicibacterium vulneris]
MSGWGDWQSPDEQAAIQRSAEEAQRRAGMTEFEKQALSLVGALVDSVGQLVGVVGSRQPADPICDNCGALQRVQGEWPTITFDARKDRAAEQLAAKHPLHPYPFWAGVVADVLAAMNWIPTTAGDGSGESAGPVSPSPGPARPASTTH